MPLQWNPITPEAFNTPGQGLTLSGTNWFPGEAAYIYIFDQDGNEVYNDTTNFIVGANGTVVANIVLASAPAVGTYYATFDDDGFYFHTDVLGHYVSVGGSGEGDESGEGIPFSVAEAAPELAATGSESAPLVAGGLLLLVLGGALLVGIRRRADAR